MARVTIKSGAFSFEAISRVMKSRKLGDQLEAIARPVLEAAREDPNKEYVASLRMKQFVSSGRGGRVSIQIGAAPILGSRIEAKRGTLQRALGRAGL